MKGSNKGQPKVKIGGEEVDVREGHGDAGSVVWGVMLVSAGGILLLNYAGVVPWDFWNNVWKFWPVVLIFAGVHVIMGNNVLSRLILLVLAIAVFGLVILFSLQQVGVPLPSWLPVEVLQILESMKGVIR